MVFNDGMESFPVVVFAHSLVFNSPAQPSAVVLFLIKDSKLIESVPQQNGANMFIMDAESRYIAASDKDLAVPANLRYEHLQGDSGMIYMKSDAGQTALSYITSQVTGWKYVSVLPAALFNEKMKNLRLLTWLSIALCLIIGGLVTVLLLRRNYMPVQLMLHSLSKQFGLRFDRGRGANEYAFLEGRFNINSMKSRYANAAPQTWQYDSGAFAAAPPEGYADHDQSLQSALPAHDIRFRSERSVVLLISIDHFGKFEEFGIRGLPDQKQQMLFSC